MTKYTFRTIVAPDQVRADFTNLRDQLNSSDKELMQAFWNIAMANIEALNDEVKRLKEQTAIERAEKRELKLAAKKAQAEPKVAPKKAAKKTAKKKASKPVNEVVTTVESDDDFEVMVVDGTK